MAEQEPPEIRNSLDIVREIQGKLEGQPLEAPIVQAFLDIYDSDEARLKVIESIAAVVNFQDRDPSSDASDKAQTESDLRINETSAALIDNDRRVKRRMPEYKSAEFDIDGLMWVLAKTIDREAGGISHNPVMETLKRLKPIRDAILDPSNETASA